MRPLIAAALLVLSAPAIAAEPAARTPDSEIAHLPAERSAMQSAVIAGKPLAYQVRVGAIAVTDDKGKTIGQVMYTAYLVPGRGPRPVSFAFNGGPGAASAYLNFGAIGPKHLQFGAQGDAPSDRTVPGDNPNSWLDFTDLVFLDPVGTGFSRSFVDTEQSKKAFYNAEADIQYLSRVVFDWLVANKRMASKKYLIGESYGGYRAPRITYALQSKFGVGLNGVVMVSPGLSMPLLFGGDADALSPIGYASILPSMHATLLDQQGKLHGPADLAAVEAYARGEFLTDLVRGRSDRQGLARLVRNVTALTGLDPTLVQQLDGRIGVRTFLREVHRSDRKIGSVYDANVTGDDPFPASPEQRADDPVLLASLAPVTGAAVDLVTNQLGFAADGPYRLLNFALSPLWDWDKGETAVVELRKAIAADPHLGVIIAHGMNDLSCPYFVSRLLIDQMPDGANRIQLALFPGGHMFYSRAANGVAFKQAAAALYR